MGLGFPGAIELQLHFAEGDHFAGLQRRLGDLVAVDVGAVGGAEIADVHVLAPHHQLGVAAGDGLMREGDVVLVVATDRSGFLRKLKRGWLDSFG